MGAKEGGMKQLERFIDRIISRVNINLREFAFDVDPYVRKIIPLIQFSPTPKAGSKVSILQSRSDLNAKNTEKCGKKSASAPAYT
jgi:hypothetical protein